jgi:protein gp37
MGEYGQHVKGERFHPRFFPERLGEPAKRKKPARIFVVSMGDLFGWWVPSMWFLEVQWAAWKAPQHTYLWLTKAGRNLSLCDWQKNDWIGVTVTEQRGLTNALYGLWASEGAGVRFISFEPLLGPVSLPDEAADILDWIIIGAQTGPGAIQPSGDRVRAITRFAEAHSIPVFIKNNIEEWPVMRREFPV